MNKNPNIAEYEEGIPKWYYLNTTDGVPMIVETTKVLSTGKSEWGYINHLTPPYKTKKALIEDNEILEKPCVECGGVAMVCYTQRELLKQRNMCFGCSLWTDRIADINLDKTMIVDHQMYNIGPEDAGNFMRGFGGQKFTFIKNGKLTESTNVWFGGDIPKIFWDRLPDNASRVQGNPPLDMSKL